MDLFEQIITQEELFKKIYFSKTEEELSEVIVRYPNIFADENWFPLGDNQNNIGVIENQQSSPIAALIEKITNSIDAILIKECFLQGIDPKSSEAPKSMDNAISRFFPDSKNWDLSNVKKQQAEDIQILADGYYKDRNKNTSLIIYDNGEGQHPEDFENTFLSLLKGNKNEIHFVQGKYNMGGTGSIIFCGKKRFQLIASKRFTNDGEFGFTLIRRHDLTEEEKKSIKNRWYEYFKMNAKIPSFKCDSLDLGLLNRRFLTGTIIKLYSYDLPTGSSSVISRDLNQSINEYLFEPALPIYTIDNKERYPDDINLERDLYGLKRRIESDNKYIEDHFSEHYSDQTIGSMKITCYVFKPRIKDKNAKESRVSIRREFFKNNMSVLFSVNGQTHAHYTSEFISRTVKLPLLKNSLLIHVDCTNMNLEFRNELFMASRDRLKDGEESRILRQKLGGLLSKGKLKELNKKRKDSLMLDSDDTSDLIKNFTKNLPLNSEILKLLNKSFKLDITESKPKQKSSTTQKKKKEEEFESKRFPSFLKLDKKNDGKTPVAKIPMDGEKTLKFKTDVEDQYFDRIEEPGDLELSLLDIKPNDETGGNKPGTPKKITDIFNVAKTSPNKGTIKVIINPTETVGVGDTIQIKVSLSGAGEFFDEIFWVQITDKQKPINSQKKEKPDENQIGLPKHILVYKEPKDNAKSWKDFDSTDISMVYETVMHPLIEDDKLDSIFINMDSNVLKTYKSKLKTREQFEIADKRYISTVYFHTLFLYTISKNKNYRMFKDEENEVQVDITDYLKDVFESYYSAFLLNFEISDLMDSLVD